MAETMESLEDEIRNSLLDQGKDEIGSGEFKISIKGGGQIEISELPPLNVEQLNLPLAIEPKEPQKGEEE